MLRLALLVVVGLQLGWLASASPVQLDLLMPNVSPKTKDIYLCQKFKMDEEQPVYITEFEANSTKAIAHHILLYGCEHTMAEDLWDCGEMSKASSSEQAFASGPVCQGPSSIVFAWALDAPKLVLPKNVAFKLGGNTKIKYLVLQVHYASVDKFINGGTDNSGLILKGQTEPTENTAGVYILGSGGFINPNKVENFESACEIQESVEMHPFAYRTHTHKLGVVNSGYVVKTDAHTGEQTWTELGRRSPQLPQMFFPVSNEVTVGRGDILAARCTMKNFRDHIVRIGQTGDDEMCNFYVMYYVKGERLLNNQVCFSMGPPYFHLSDFRTSKNSRLDLKGMPKDASEVPEIQLKQLSDMGSMENMHHTSGMGSMPHTGHSGEKLMPKEHHVAHSHDESSAESSSVSQELDRLLSNELHDDHFKYSHVDKSGSNEQSGENLSEELINMVKKPSEQDELEQYLNELANKMDNRRKFGPRRGF